MLKPLSFQLSCGGNVVIMLYTEVCENCPFASNITCQGCRQGDDMQKGWKMWDTMHELDRIAKDAVINERPLDLVVQFMEDVLTSEDERVYFLQAYTKSLKSECYKMGYDDGYNDAY